MKNKDKFSSSPGQARSVPTLALFLAVAAGLSAFAADWRQFRGPNGSGIAADDAQPATTWSDSQNVKWKVALPGPGSSSPIVAGERVFVTCYSGYGDGSSGDSPEKLQRHLVCLERKTGKVLWDKSVPAELPEDPYSGNLREHGYASNTPVTDGERVFAFFGKTGVLAFDFEGQQLWKVNVGRQSSNRRWGSGASLILCQNMVIVNAAEESRSILALNKLTGKEVWKAEVDSLELSFVTPALVECAGGRIDLALAVPGELWGLNPDTGKLRWFAQTGITGNVSPSVVAADGVVYATGGYPRQGTIAVRAGGKGDVTQTNVLWSSQNASYVPSPVVHHGHLFCRQRPGVCHVPGGEDRQARLQGALARRQRRQAVLRLSRPGERAPLRRKPAGRHVCAASHPAVCPGRAKQARRGRQRL